MGHGRIVPLSKEREQWDYHEQVQRPQVFVSPPMDHVHAALWHRCSSDGRHFGKGDSNNDAQFERMVFFEGLSLVDRSETVL